MPGCPAPITYLTPKEMNDVDMHRQHSWRRPDRAASHSGIARQVLLLLLDANVGSPIDLASRFEHGGRTHAGTDAHGHHPKAGSPAATRHFVQQRRCQLSPRAAQGVPDGDGPPVRVHLFNVQAQLLDAVGGLQAGRQAGSRSACSTNLWKRKGQQVGRTDDYKCKSDKK